MQTINVRIRRSLILTFVLGVALTPISPDTGSIAEPRIPHRIATAHALVQDAPPAFVAASIR